MNDSPAAASIGVHCYRLPQSFQSVPFAGHRFCDSCGTVTDWNLVRIELGNLSLDPRGLYRCEGCGETNGGPSRFTDGEHDWNLGVRPGSQKEWCQDA